MRKTSCCTIFTLFLLSVLLYLAPSTWPSNGRVEREDTEKLRETYLPFNFPHPVETINEGLPYRYFEDEEVYQLEGEVQREISLHEHAFLSQAKDVASLTHSESTFVSGRYRWLPEGVEYDLLYEDQVKGHGTRVTLFQKLNNPQHVRAIDVNSHKPVHVVVALQGRIDKYTTFLNHIITSVLPSDPHFTLTVVYFNDKQMKEAREITSNHLAQHPGFKWSFLQVEGEGKGGGRRQMEKYIKFSRGLGLHIGALNITQNPDDLIFFCDVDVMMMPKFLDRCRANVVAGRQVYYPVVYSLYNPQLVYPLQDKVVPPITQQLAVGEGTGFWRDFGYGMVCVSRGDYMAAGGFPDIRSWGGEDDALYQYFLMQEHIKVIRAPDPGLFHLYHAKDCVQTDSAAYVACLKSKAVTEGSKIQLGLTFLKTHHGIDLEGVLSKRFYYFWLVPYLGLLLAVSLLTNLLQAVLLHQRRSQGCKLV